MLRTAWLGGALAVLALAGVGFGAGPALAAAPTVTIVTPDVNAGATPLTDPVLHITGQASMPSGGTVNANSITITVTASDGHPGGSTTVGNSAGNPAPYSWDLPTTFNGAYHIQVVATGRDGAIDTNPNEVTNPPATRDVLVEVKPVPPANLNATKSRSRTVSLTWDSNPEPDIVGYQVQRQVGSGDWQALALVASPGYTDTSTANAGGTYTYRIVAARQGATKDRVVVSDPSATKSVSVPDAPVTTTSSTATTAPTGGSTGTGPGGSTGGSTAASGSSANTQTAQLARTGNVDLSGFATLLKEAQRPGTGKPGEGPDPGFNQTLPFKKGSPTDTGEDGTALGVGIHEAGGGTEATHQPIAFVAASLLVTVILMHVLWLKREVDRLPAELPATE